MRRPSKEKSAENFKKIYGLDPTPFMLEQFIKQYHPMPKFTETDRVAIRKRAPGNDFNNRKVGGQTKFNDNTIQKALDLRKQGLSHQKIADAIGSISRNRVRQFCVEYNVQ